METEKQTRSIDVEEERESVEIRKCQDDCCLVLLGSEEAEDVIREGKT